MPFAIYPKSGYPMSRIFRLLRRTALAAAFATAFVVWTSAGGLPAGAGDVFSVSAISVDETADTAAAARARAFRRGQRAALTTILRRLTVRADHARLPAVDNERLDFMVQALEVADEKTSDVRYLANMTVNFKPPEIRRLLRESAIPFAETPSKPVLVLPVLRQGGALVLWDDPNLWREAWSRMPVSGDLVPLIVPVGDLSDIADVDATQAADGDPLRLSAIAGRYHLMPVMQPAVTSGAGSRPPSTLPGGSRMPNWIYESMIIRNRSKNCAVSTSCHKASGYSPCACRYRGDDVGSSATMPYQEVSNA